MSNPLDEYAAYMEESVAEVEKDSAVRMNLLPPQTNTLGATQDKEMRMWQTWDAGGRKPEHLRPLMNSMSPLIHHAMGTWRGRIKFMPDEALEAEFKNHAVKALQTYNPNRGAKLSTWVRTNLRKGGRFAKTYQNVGRIVEERQGSIANFKNTKEYLGEQYGRPATDAELLRELKKDKSHKWSIPEIQRMNSELRADVLSSSFESDMNVWSPTLDNEVSMYLHEELNANEQKVYNLIQNPGNTQGKTGLIAKQLGWSPAKVSRLRKSIERKAKEQMQGLM